MSNGTLGYIGKDGWIIGHVPERPGEYLFNATAKYYPIESEDTFRINFESNFYVNERRKQVSPMGIILIGVFIIIGLIVLLLLLSDNGSGKETSESHEKDKIAEKEIKEETKKHDYKRTNGN
jgi:hypothetical protein